MPNQTPVEVGFNGIGLLELCNFKLCYLKSAVSVISCFPLVEIRTDHRRH